QLIDFILLEQVITHQFSLASISFIFIIYEKYPVKVLFQGVRFTGYILVDQTEAFVLIIEKEKGRRARQRRVKRK
ncbi:MAG: hypothetical protein V1761_00935, partial [bacterium]